MAIVIVTPLLLWQDYLYAIYRGSTAAGIDHITVPLAGYLSKWRAVIEPVLRGTIDGTQASAVCILVSLSSQVIFLAVHRTWREPWWRLAAAFAVLLLVVNYAVWEGYPGAATRVLLPLTFGFNVLLANVDRRFWWWYVTGNLHLIPAAGVLPFPWLAAPY